MNIPGFDAELSLAPTMGIYRGKAVFGRSGTAGVTPAQTVGFSTSPFLVTTRCCQWSPIVGRFVCTSRAHPPWVECRCIRTTTFPVILCRDPVLSSNL